MRFRYKILLAIWSVVLSLLVITFFIINYWTRGHIEQTFSDELRSNYATLRVLNALQSETLIRGCLVIAESPRLRAVVELRDPTTASQLSKELHQTTVSDLLMLTDNEGKVLEKIVEGKQVHRNAAGLGTIRRALERVPSTDVWAIDGRIYRIATAPIMVGNELVGTLTIGFRIGLEDLRTLKQATNSEILLLDKRNPVLSTMKDGQETVIVGALFSSSEWLGTFTVDTNAHIFRLETGSEAFLGTLYRLDLAPVGEDARIALLVLKRIDEEVNRAMAPILGTFGVVSVLFLVFTTILGHFISKGITRPIATLMRGTTEIGKGNYDYVIKVEGHDEMAFLAEQFGEMSRSLKEKINELARANTNLSERNADLDEALRKLQEAQNELVRNERLAATGKLTAQLAHEINNPIHNVQSSLKTALSRLPAEIKGRELIEVAFEEINRMSKLTRQMLDFYRTSIVTEELKPVELPEVIHEVLAASEEELNRSNIRVSVQMQPALPPVLGSKDKLKQVFLNLILNARDAMAKNGTLRIDLKKGDHSVLISFSDSGVGIPSENLNRIFDAFFTTKGKVSGVGLGLSVSYGIISQHGGQIKVESVVGKGSTFTVVLPCLAGETAVSNA